MRFVVGELRKGDDYGYNKYKFFYQNFKIYFYYGCVGENGGVFQGIVDGNKTIIGYDK